LMAGVPLRNKERRSRIFIKKVDDNKGERHGLS